MTPYESLVWNIWLPKVRSTIKYVHLSSSTEFLLTRLNRSNDWSPLDPSPLIHVIEAWSDLLPQFVYDNVMDQLIIPKLHKAVADFNLRRDKVSLQAMVFPWLPHVGLRVEEVLNEARRKVKSLFRAWAVTEGIPEDIIAWKYVSVNFVMSRLFTHPSFLQVFDASDWEGMLLKYVVPKLGATLRDDFKINPRKQNMEPLNWVLKWANLIRPSTFSHLLEAEFFPKWLDILHMWLVSPNPNFDEVTQW
jgi:tuftelin-interacting protein 11